MAWMLTIIPRFKTKLDFDRAACLRDHLELRARELKYTPVLVPALNLALRAKADDWNQRNQKAAEKIHATGRRVRNIPPQVVPRMIRDVDGDLSTIRRGSVAHCVGLDCTMGAGVARDLKKRFGRPNIPEGFQVGDVLKRNRKVRDGIVTIYELFTKPKSAVPAVKTDPKGEVLRATLEKLYKDVAANDKIVNLPAFIGCGLDGHPWSEVFMEIAMLSRKYDVETILWHYTPKNSTPKGIATENKSNARETQPKSKPRSRSTGRNDDRDGEVRHKQSEAAAKPEPQASPK